MTSRNVLGASCNDSLLLLLDATRVASITCPFTGQVRVGVVFIYTFGLWFRITVLLSSHAVVVLLHPVLPIDRFDTFNISRRFWLAIDRVSREFALVARDESG